MKLKLSISISMILFALLACESSGQAQIRTPPKGPIGAPQLPRDPVGRLPIPSPSPSPKPSLFGTITFPVPSNPKLSSFTCSDFKIVVGVDAQTGSGKPGDISLPFLQPVASAQATAKSQGQCSYRVSGMPVGKPFKVELQLSNSKRFACDQVPFDYIYFPVFTMETITFGADQIKERNFQVQRLQCLIIH